MRGVLLLRRRAGDQHVDGVATFVVGDEILRPMDVGEAVKGTSVGQRFETTLVATAEVDALEEVHDAGIRTVGVAFFHNTACRTETDALQGRQTETDIPVLVHGEGLVRLVDIGTLHHDVVFLAVFDISGDFLDVSDTVRQVGSHVLSTVMRFEIGRLVGHPRVTGGMGFVESVGSELLPVGPDFLQDFGIVPIGFAAFNELGFQGIQLVFQLLTHGFTQCVGLATREVGQQSRQQHHLLLIDGDAVGVLQVLLHDGDVVLDFLASLLTVDELRNVVHRAGTIEGVHSDKILKRRGLQLAQVLLHTAGFKLECAHRVAIAIELVGQRVIQRNVVNIHLHPLGFLDVRDRLLEDGEGGKSEEVHLDQANVFNH